MPKLLTDTSTFVFVDVDVAKTYEQHEDADWWCDEEDELAEVNAGRALFIGVGTDGIYRFEQTDEPLAGVALKLKCPSGCLALLAAEGLPSMGMALDEDEVAFISAPTPVARVHVERKGDFRICFSIEPDSVEGPAVNDIEEPIRLFDP